MWPGPHFMGPPWEEGSIPSACLCNLLSLSLPVAVLQVMLLGDSAVGKTCILVRFKDGAFLGGNFIATVGIDFRVRLDAVFLK